MRCGIVIGADGGGGFRVRCGQDGAGEGSDCEGADRVHIGLWGQDLLVFVFPDVERAMRVHDLVVVARVEDGGQVRAGNRRFAHAPL
ncbi:MAG: hypothetical protein ACPG61_03330 [Paracoccaceae bacterium]